MHVPIEKVLEFGGRFDAVSQLGHIMDAKRKKGVDVHNFVTCDQFGIAHPP
jgi:hypothetical protein